jgi:hypothetical protein
MVGKRAGIGGAEDLRASRAGIKDKKNPIWNKKGLDAHRPSGLFPPRMKKVSFIITPAQHDAFERVRRASPLGVEPSAAVARRLFLIGLVQADVTKTTNKKSK